MRTTNDKRFAHYSLALKDKPMTTENVTTKPERPFLHLKSTLLRKQSLDLKNKNFQLGMVVYVSLISAAGRQRQIDLYESEFSLVY